MTAEGRHLVGGDHVDFKVGKAHPTELDLQGQQRDAAERARRGGPGGNPPAAGHKDSMRVRRLVAGWDDEVLASLITARNLPPIPLATPGLVTVAAPGIYASPFSGGAQNT